MLESNWHCRVTSLSKDVIYEDVCTVEGFSVKKKKSRPCGAMSQHERYAWEAADEAKHFISFIQIWECSVEWKKLFGLWKFPNSDKCEGEE